MEAARGGPRRHLLPSPPAQQEKVRRPQRHGARWRRHQGDQSPSLPPPRPRPSTAAQPRQRPACGAANARGSGAPKSARRVEFNGAGGNEAPARHALWLRCASRRQRGESAAGGGRGQRPCSKPPLLSSPSLSSVTSSSRPGQGEERSGHRPEGLVPPRAAGRRQDPRLHPLRSAPPPASTAPRRAARLPLRFAAAGCARARGSAALPAGCWCVGYDLGCACGDGGAGDPVEEVVNKIHSFLRQTADDMENNRLAVPAPGRPPGKRASAPTAGRAPTRRDAEEAALRRVFAAGAPAAPRVDSAVSPSRTSPPSRSCGPGPVPGRAYRCSSPARS